MSKNFQDGEYKEKAFYNKAYSYFKKKNKAPHPSASPSLFKRLLLILFFSICAAEASTKDFFQI